MRARLLVVVLASTLAVGLGLGFSRDGSVSPAAESVAQPSPVDVDVEVLGKVVQPSPTKAAVDVDVLPRTGADMSGVALLVGLVLVALGLVAIDVSGWSRSMRARLAWRRRVGAGG